MDKFYFKKAYVRLLGVLVKKELGQSSTYINMIEN